VPLVRPPHRPSSPRSPRPRRPGPRRPSTRPRPSNRPGTRAC
jgi:hypothetical protein